MPDMFHEGAAIGLPPPPISTTRRDSPMGRRQRSSTAATGQQRTTPLPTSKVCAMVRHRKDAEHHQQHTAVDSKEMQTHAKSRAACVNTAVSGHRRRPISIHLTPLWLQRGGSPADSFSPVASALCIRDICQEQERRQKPHRTSPQTLLLWLDCEIRPYKATDGTLLWLGTIMLYRAIQRSRHRIFVMVDTALHP